MINPFKYVIGVIWLAGIFAKVTTRRLWQKGARR